MHWGYTPLLDEQTTSQLGIVGFERIANSIHDPPGLDVIDRGSLEQTQVARTIAQSQSILGVIQRDREVVRVIDPMSVTTKSGSWVVSRRLRHRGPG